VLLEDKLARSTRRLGARHNRHEFCGSMERMEKVLVSSQTRLILGHCCTKKTLKTYMY